LAERLQNVGPVLPHQVLDATGSTGAWDVTLTFSLAPPAGGGARGATKGGPPGFGGGDAPGSSDPSGSVSLFEALEKQLGLKLELHKRPLPVLVIDHVEENPTAN
jgi:uncharacterized protein (TIGR03435 family)